MSKIAVIGKEEVVLGFKALGIELGLIKNPDEVSSQLKKFSGDPECALILITEDLYPETEELKEIKPVVAIMPAPAENKGLAANKIRSVIKRALGMELK